MKRRILLALVLLATVALPAVADSHVSIELLSQPRVGVPMTVRVTAPPGTGTLEVLTAFGGSSHPVTVDQTGSVEVELPATEIAGDLTLIVIIADNSGWIHVRLRPDVESVVRSITVAPERLVVGDPRPLTLVGFVSDRFGNPAGEAARVDLSVRLPDGSVIAGTADSRRGLVVFEFDDDATEGLGEARAQVGDSVVVTPVVFYPAGPTTFGFLAPEVIPPADGLSRVTLSTGPLVDSFGNPIPDGSSMQVVIQHDDGSVDLIPARVVAQQVRVSLAAPARPETLVIKGSLLGTDSTPLALVFRS